MKKLLVVLLLSLTLIACGKDSKQEIIISTWGLSEDILMEDVYGPFEKENDVKVVLDIGTTNERYTKFKNDKNSKIDIIELSQKAAADGYIDELFEKLDYSKLHNFDSLIDSAKQLTKSGYGPAYTINSIGIIYDPESIDFEITEWKDLWRPELKDSISLPDITTTFGPHMVVMASDVYGVDIADDNGETGFKALEDLKDNIVKTYAKSSDLAMMFASKEIKVAVVGDFGYPVIKKAADNVEYVIPTSGTYANFNTLDININSENKELAYKFIDYRLSLDVQARNGRVDTLNEAPVNKDVVLSDDDAAYKTYGDVAAKAKVLDYSIINPLMEQWVDTYNRLMNQ